MIDFNIKDKSLKCNQEEWIDIINLEQLGWNEYFEKKFQEDKKEGYTVARVFAEHKHMYKLYTEHGEVLGEVSGKFRYEALSQQEFPAVGDWVVISLRLEEKSATIHKVLPRKTKFSRKVAGVLTEEQIVASNIDTVFLVNALNNDFNLRKIERYLIMAWESGAEPVIVLSKADLCTDLDECIKETEKIAVGVPIHVISAFTGNGIENLQQYVKQGKTVALLGSSGVGKSTLINYFLKEEIQETKEVREGDDRGRHTSTYREMFILPEGGIMMDTPGMRELQLWGGDEGISEAFEDIDELAAQCRFADCKHKKEPGCAVNQAIANGLLSEERFENYKKLQKEIRMMEKKQSRIDKTNDNKKTKAYLKYKLQGI